MTDFSELKFYSIETIMNVRVLDHERNNEGSMLLYNLAVMKNSKMKVYTGDESKKKQRNSVKTMLIASELVLKRSLNEH